MDINIALCIWIKIYERSGCGRLLSQFLTAYKGAFTDVLEKVDMDGQITWYSSIVKGLWHSTRS